MKPASADACNHHQPPSGQPLQPLVGDWWWWQRSSGGSRVVGEVALAGDWVNVAE